MSVSNLDKEKLRTMRDDLQQLQTMPETLAIQKEVDHIDLSYISALELKLICNPDFVIGIDFGAIDTASPFSVSDMNFIAPGAIDENEFRKKMALGSLVAGKTTDVIDSQSGNIIVTDESILNGNVETLVESRTASQGINLQMINQGAGINAESSAESAIPSKFVGVQ